MRTMQGIAGATMLALALVQQFIDAMASGKTGTRPKECVGVDDKTVEKFAEQILSGETETTTP